MFYLHKVIKTVKIDNDVYTLQYGNILVVTLFNSYKYLFGIIMTKNNANKVYAGIENNEKVNKIFSAYINDGIQTKSKIKKKTLWQILKSLLTKLF